MKCSELRIHQEAVEPFVKGARVSFQKIEVVARVLDLERTGIKFYGLIKSEYINELTVDIFHTLTPAELRWMADVWEHFDRWLNDQEDWPLPIKCDRGILNV